MAIAIAISTDASNVLAIGAIFDDRRKVINVAPMKPPTLNRAWKPDMSGLAAARSTSTA